MIGTPPSLDFKSRFTADPVARELPPLEGKGVSDFSYKMWQEIYDQDYVGSLRGKKHIREIAAATE